MNEDQPVPGTEHVTWDTAMIKVVSDLGILTVSEQRKFY